MNETSPIDPGDEAVKKIFDEKLPSPTERSLATPPIPAAAAQRILDKILPEVEKNLPATPADTGTASST
jgi:hypothetical protein